MSDRLFFILGMITLVICMYFIFMTELARKEFNQMRKSCELAEISPDFSSQEKAQCRILRRIK
jgi:hypothetical protein